MNRRTLRTAPIRYAFAAVLAAAMPAALAAPLDCANYTSAVTPAPYNTWTAVDAYCPSDRSATGGGYFFHEGSLGVPNIWVMHIPLSNGWRTWVDNQNAGPRNVQTYVRCCKTI
ncbi:MULTISPECIES: hypothetical protein [Lysobacter]|uniref:Secreted protein n=2 Tax=Lysobacter TaxID=68 RepID=A0A0S2DG71_LYSEN|nr:MULTISPECIES: hypothetical protein [Lysobacter]ALN57374.1 hypothetical protein GLE_2024 [Lysobacter enzymogenes]QCW25998.1 hypothetical protein FE772_10270 [Lysobacter enzymogenes]QQP99438.1 hypothetical protein JHW41_15060 [Lysobacter enzymogenes]ROU06694.1 hypothetical protein D9T17_12650 [Lysobacter enzymogenes]UZW58889.1 hypothetical protein BV903_016420 [Lysobacter enzymogenes]